MSIFSERFTSEAYWTIVVRALVAKTYTKIYFPLETPWLNVVNEDGLLAQFYTEWFVTIQNNIRDVYTAECNVSLACLASFFTTNVLWSKNCPIFQANSVKFLFLASLASLVITPDLTDLLTSFVSSFFKNSDDRSTSVNT